MNTHGFLARAIMIAGLCQCGVRAADEGGATPPQRVESMQKLAAVLNGNGVFAFNFYRTVREKEGNLCFSPYNIGVAFGMAWIGARGETAEEMAEILHFPGTEEHTYAITDDLERGLNRLGQTCGFRLDAANGVWVQKGIAVRTSYLDVLGQAYASSCGTLDLQDAPVESANTVNRWISEQTRGTIPDLVSADSLKVRPGAPPGLVLMSAFSFHSTWQMPFDETATRNERFTRLDGSTVSCRMMHRKSRYLYGSLPGLQILEIPYRGAVLSMLILLPRQNADFAKLEESLTFRRVAGFLRGLQRKQFMEVQLPCFSIDTRIDLNPVLRNLGMRRAFTPAKADFSGITRAKPFWIDKALHCAVIRATEKGTEIAPKSKPEANKSPALVSIRPRFRADHPFIYLIRERRTGAVLLLGRVLDPSE